MLEDRNKGLFLGWKLYSTFKRKIHCSEYAEEGVEIVGLPRLFHIEQCKGDEYADRYYFLHDL